MSLKSMVFSSIVMFALLSVSSNKVANKTISFSHALIYEYETLTSKGQFWIYHNPKSGSLLFVPEDEMVEFVLADTRGNYYTFGDNGHSEKTVTHQRVDWKRNNPNITIQTLPLKRYIHQEISNQPTIECSGFTMIFNEEVKQQTVFYTESISINAYQIYALNQLNSDVKLPVPAMDLMNVLTQNQLVTHLENDVFKVELIAYEYNPYDIEVSEYSYYKQSKNGIWQKAKLPTHQF